MEEKDATGLDKDLIFAASSGDIAKVRALLAAGANVEATWRGETALTKAKHAYAQMWCGRDLVELLEKAREGRKIVISPGENLDERLLKAAGAGDIAAVRALLAAGANVNALNEVGATPVMCAAGVAKTETVRVLLAAGANVNARSSLGTTALYLAKVALELGQLEGAREVIALLREAGAK